MTIFTDLISNVALLLALSILYSFLTRIWKKGEIRGQILTGILFGGVAVVGMILPFRYGSGIIFDGRSIVMSMAGLFGGPVTAAISTLVAGSYRLGLGGTGAFTGFFVIFTSAALGVGYHYLRRKNPAVIKPLYLLVFGVIVHISMLLCMLTLSWPLAFEVLNKISIPVMLIFPLGTVFLGTLLADQEERNYTQDALKESQAKLLQAQYIARTGDFTWDIATGAATWSDGMYELLKYDKNETIDYEKVNADIHHPEDIERVTKWLMDGIASGKEFITPNEYRLICKNGEVLYVQTNGQIEYQDGKAVRFFGTCQDITERKQAEKALRESEAQKAAILDGISTNLAFVNEDLEILWANKISADSVNRNVDEIIGHKCYELWADPNAPCDDCPTAKAFQTKKTEQTIIHSPDGRVWEEKGEPVFDEKGGLIGVLEIAHDITAKAQTEEALRESERRLSIKNRIAHILLTVPDEEMYGEVLHVILEATGSRYGIFGYIDEKGAWVCPSLTRDIWDRCRVSDKNIVFPREQWGGIWGKAMVEKKPLYSNGPFRVPEGHIPILRSLDVPVIHQGKLIGNLLVGNKETDYGEKDKELLESLSGYIAPVLHARLQRDIKEGEKDYLETQLQQAQKMEAIGTLAGGIAHDFNNILGGIIGYAELAKMKAPEGSNIIAYLDKMIKSGDRAADLIKQILTLSRQHKQKQRPVQVRHIIKETLSLLRATLPTTIEIRQDLAKDAGVVNADPTQMHQVIMNLATNAGHAMQKDGGVLEVTLANVELDDLSAEKHLDLDAGSYLRLTVSDTGYGMTSEIMERIFDPYFTTKDTGEGTGLGLSVAQGIIKAHGGTITVYSEMGKGTTFHVYLPLILEEEREEKKSEGPLPTGNERILFIDDEQVLVDIGGQILEQLGYEVVTKRSSVQALELFRAEPDRFDLVITDMTMPHMTGDKLAQELMKIRPKIPIILCTGHSGLVSEEKAEEIGIKAFVMKPLVMRNLAETVRKVLDAGRSEV